MCSAAVVRLATLSAFSSNDEAETLAWLNADEHERLGVITAPRRRQQFLAGHALARRLAAEVGGGNLAAWQLQSGQGGAPVLIPPNMAMAGLHVSLSHSGDWVGCAIARAAIGLDLETSEKPRDLPALAKFAFSPAENSVLQKLPGAAQADAFYTIWTLKEAQGKHAGTGLHLAELRRQGFCECCPKLARAITWKVSALNVAVCGEPGLQAHLESDPSASSPRYWRLESDPAAG